MYFILFDTIICVTDQLVQLAEVSLPIIALFWPYTLGLIDFKGALLFLEQIKKIIKLSISWLLCLVWM
jgi:hypothetical protein